MTTETAVIADLAAAASIARRRARRLSFMALGMGCLGLIALVVANGIGSPAPWTSWMLAILLTTNPAVYLLSQRWQAHRAALIYFRVAGAATLVVCAGILVRLWDW